MLIQVPCFNSVTICPVTAETSTVVAAAARIVVRIENKSETRTHLLVQQAELPKNASIPVILQKLELTAPAEIPC